VDLEKPANLSATPLILYAEVSETRAIMPLWNSIFKAILGGF